MVVRADDRDAAWAEDERGFFDEGLAGGLRAAIGFAPFVKKRLHLQLPYLLAVFQLRC
jgi:hypothetical protein